MHHALNLRLLTALCEVTRCLQWHSERHGVGMDAKAVEDAKAAIAEAQGRQRHDAESAIAPKQEPIVIAGEVVSGLRPHYHPDTQEIHLINNEGVIIATVHDIGQEPRAKGAPGETQAAIGCAISAALSSLRA